jgi:hypothetical protein
MILRILAEDFFNCYVASNEIARKYEKIWKEADMTCCKVISRHSPGESRENRKKYQSG